MEKTLDEHTITCRISAKEFPDVDDITMVNVTTVSEAGIYVSLLEYNGMEGLISYGESSRRSRCHTNNIKVGQQLPAAIYHIDKEKGFIDLSVKRVSPDESEECMKRFTESKIVYEIVKQLADKFSKPVNEYYENYIWKLEKKFCHVYESLKIMLTKPESITKIIKMPDEEWTEFVRLVSKKMRTKNSCASADVSIMCLSGGIDSIKEILISGEIDDDAPLKLGLDNCHVSVKYKGAPIYTIMTNSFDRQCALNALDKSIKNMEQKTNEREGMFEVTIKPYIVGECDKKDMIDKIDSDDSDTDDEFDTEDSDDIDEYEDDSEESEDDSEYPEEDPVLRTGGN